MQSKTNVHTYKDHQINIPNPYERLNTSIPRAQKQKVFSFVDKPADVNNKSTAKQRQMCDFHQSAPSVGALNYKCPTQTKINMVRERRLLDMVNRIVKGKHYVPNHQDEITLSEYMKAYRLNDEDVRRARASQNMAKKEKKENQRKLLDTKRPYAGNKYDESVVPVSEYIDNFSPPKGPRHEGFSPCLAGAAKDGRVEQQMWERVVSEAALVRAKNNEHVDAIGAAARRQYQHQQQHHAPHEPAALDDVETPDYEAQPHSVPDQPPNAHTKKKVFRRNNIIMQCLSLDNIKSKVIYGTVGETRFNPGTAAASASCAAAHPTKPNDVCHIGNEYFYNAGVEAHNAHTIPCELKPKRPLPYTLTARRHDVRKTHVQLQVDRGQKKGTCVYQSKSKHAIEKSGDGDDDDDVFKSRATMVPRRPMTARSQGERFWLDPK